MIAKQEKKMGDQLGQSIIEYVVLVAIIVAALIVFLGRGSVFEKSYNATIQTQGDDMVNMSKKIFN